MYLAKTLTSRSLPEIGRRFGGRDHTTVLHAIRKIESLKQNDGALKEELKVALADAERRHNLTERAYFHRLDLTDVAKP